MHTTLAWALPCLIATLASATTSAPSNAPTENPTSAPTSGAQKYQSCIAANNAGVGCPCFNKPDWKGAKLGWVNDQMKTLRICGSYQGVGSQGNCATKPDGSWTGYSDQNALCPNDQDFVPKTAPSSAPTYFDEGLSVDAVYHDASDIVVPGYENDPDSLKKDFNCGTGSVGIEPNMLKTELDEFGLPVANKDSTEVAKNRKINSVASFYKWYHDSPETVTYDTRNETQRDEYLKPIPLRAVTCRQNKVYFDSDAAAAYDGGAAGDRIVYMYADSIRHNKPYADPTTRCACGPYQTPFDGTFGSYQNVQSISGTYKVCKPAVPRYVMCNKKFLPLYNKADVIGRTGNAFFFTSHIATEFLYQGHEYFKFSGDDDVWVFVNNQLVLDMGGLHAEKCRRLDISTAYTSASRPTGFVVEKLCGPAFRDAAYEFARADGTVYSGKHDLTLERGGTYKLDIFHAERCKSGSNFYMETNMKLKSVSASTGSKDLCLKMSWDRKNLTDPTSFQKKRLVRPVDGFNPQHAVVTKKVCGGANSGDPIPAVGKWSTSGNTNPKHYSCQACCDCTFSFDEKTCSGAGQVYGGSLFYAYNYPKGSSSNTGMEEKDTESIFFVKDTNNNVFLVLNHDAPGNKGGAKKMRLSITSPKSGEPGSLANKGVFIQLRDDNVPTTSKKSFKLVVGKGGIAKDPSTKWSTADLIIPAGYECPRKVSNNNWDKVLAGRFANAADTFETKQSGTKVYIRRIGSNQDNWGVNVAFDCFLMPSCAASTSDCYAWDTTTGQGTFAWSWAGCCTDGMVLGPLPGNDFKINLEYTMTIGLDHFKIGDYDNGAKSLNLIDLTYQGTKKDYFFADGIEVAGFSCKAYCETITTCGGCTSDPACGWCDNGIGNAGVCSSLSEESEKSTCTNGGGAYHPSGCDACLESCAFKPGEAETCEVCTAKPAGCGFMITDPYKSWQKGKCLPGNFVAACTVNDKKAPLYFGDRRSFRLHVGPTGVALSGTNGGKASMGKGILKACIGECDADYDCITGLTCFQRSKGEPIPGCVGNGNGNTWDYCYNITAAPTTDENGCSVKEFDVPSGYVCPTAIDKNNWDTATSGTTSKDSFTTKIVAANKIKICRAGGVKPEDARWSLDLAFDCFEMPRTLVTLETKGLAGLHTGLQPMNISQGFTVEAWVYPGLSYALPFIALTNSDVAEECFAVEGLFSKLDAWVHVAVVFAPIAVNPTNLYLAGAKQSECNAGDMKVNKWECSDANDALISKMSLEPAKRKMQTYVDYVTTPPGGGWAGVPSGCSMQWDGKHGDRTAHLKIGLTSDVNKAAQNQIYRLLCIETSTGSPDFLTVYLDGVETTQKPVMSQACASVATLDKWKFEIGGSTKQQKYIVDMAITSFIVFDHARLFGTVREDMRDLGCKNPFWLSDAAKVGKATNWVTPVLAQILFEDVLSPFNDHKVSRIDSTVCATWGTACDDGLVLDTYDGTPLIAAVNLSTRAGCSSPESASYKERWMSVCATPFPTESPTLEPTPGPTPVPTISPTEYPTTALDEDKYPACPPSRLEAQDYVLVVNPILDSSGCCTDGANKRHGKGLTARHVWRTYKDTTRPQCKAWCDADPICAAFEIGGCTPNTPQCLGHCLHWSEGWNKEDSFWSVGPYAYSCDQQCARYGQMCDAVEMAKLKTGGFDSYKAAFTEAGKKCGDGPPGSPGYWDYATTPGSPYFENNKCYMPKETDPFVPICNGPTYAEQKGGAGAKRQALCRCKPTPTSPLRDRSIGAKRCGRTKIGENECHVKVVKLGKGVNIKAAMTSKEPVVQAVLQPNYGSRIVMFDEPCTKYASCRNATCNPKISSCISTGPTFVFQAPWNGTAPINYANGKYNPCGKEPKMQFAIIPTDTSLTVCEAAEMGFGPEWEERCARSCGDDVCYQKECTLHSHHDAKVGASTPTINSTNPFFPLPSSLSWPDGAEDMLTFNVTVNTLGNEVGINRVDLRFVGLRHAKVQQMSIKLTSPDGKSVYVMQANKNPCAKNHMGGNLEFCGANCVSDDRWKIATRRANIMASVDARCTQYKTFNLHQRNKAPAIIDCVAGEYQRMVLGPASGAKYGGTYTFSSSKGTAMQCASNDEQMGGNVGRGTILSTALQGLTGKTVVGAGVWNLTLGDSNIGMTGFFDHVELILYPVTTDIPARYLPEALTLAYAPTPDRSLLLDNKGRASSDPERYLRVGVLPSGFDPAEYPEWSESIKLWYKSPQSVGTQSIKYKQVFGCYPKKQMAQLDLQTVTADSAPPPPTVWADNVKSSSFTLKWAFTAESAQRRRRLTERSKLQLTPTQVGEGTLISVEASLTVNTHWLCWRSGNVKTAATCAAAGSAPVVISSATTGAAAVCGAVNIETAKWNDVAVTKTELFVSVIECSTESTAAVVAFVTTLTYSRITPLQATIGASLSVASLINPLTNYLCWRSGIEAANPTAACGAAASSASLVDVTAATTGGAGSICGTIGQTSATWSDSKQVEVAVIECSTGNAVASSAKGVSTMTTLTKALTIVLWKSGGLDDGWRIMPDSPPLGQNAFPFTGLMPGKTYSFEVQAVDPDSGVAGAMSDPVVVSTCPARCSVCGGNGICDECDPTSIKKDDGKTCQQVFLEGCPAQAAAVGNEMQNMFGNGRNPGEDPTGLSIAKALDKCRPDTPAKCQNCSTCPIGHQRNGCSGFSPGVCEKCGPNTFKSETGSKFSDCEKCTLCGANSYAALVCDTVRDTVCAPCPLNSTSIAGSVGASSCQCNSGFYRDEETCVPCNIDHCERCNPSGCTKCEDSGVDPANKFYVRNGGCVNTCLVGKEFGALINPVDTQSGRECRSCPVCPRGFGLTGCEGESAGTCDYCAPGTWRPEGPEFAPCQPCTQPAPGDYASVECYGSQDSIISACQRCEAGSFRVGCNKTKSGSCNPCAEGMFKDWQGTAEDKCLPCWTCPEKMFRSSPCSATSDTGVCRDCGACARGQYQQKGCSSDADVQCGGCPSCPAGYQVGVKVGGDPSVVDDLKCGGVENPTDPGVCVPCVDGTFKAARYSSPGGDQLGTKTLLPAPWDEVCLPCTKCNGDEFALTPCAGENDNDCRPCASFGRNGVDWYTDPLTQACETCTKCELVECEEDGETVPCQTVTPCTLSADALCGMVVIDAAAAAAAQALVAAEEEKTAIALGILIPLGILAVIVAITVIGVFAFATLVTSNMKKKHAALEAHLAELEEEERLEDEEDARAKMGMEMGSGGRANTFNLAHTNPTKDDDGSSDFDSEGLGGDKHALVFESDSDENDGDGGSSSAEMFDLDATMSSSEEALNLDDITEEHNGAAAAAAAAGGSNRF